MIDKKFSISDVNWETQKMISRLSPFGVGNPKPTFIFENVSTGKISWFGKNNQHLRLHIEQDGAKIPAVAFFAKDVIQMDIHEKQNLSLVATIENSNYWNEPELRLRIIDIF